ncbi:hypothetical protein ACFWNT_13070 [Streptomyces sp. NPDC058409]|uniref:hypothetical protein n=1 Tax=Streptomyces sp. NPDC058409 TaxID=3346484 RepID=UPI003661992A
MLSIDENTAIAARSRKRPGRPEFEYVRHGTASAMVVHIVTTGEVLNQPVTRNDAATFICFLAMLDRAIDPRRPVHVVLDNGASHIAKKTKAWLAARAGTWTGPRRVPPGSTRSSRSFPHWPARSSGTEPSPAVTTSSTRWTPA